MRLLPVCVFSCAATLNALWFYQPMTERSYLVWIRGRMCCFMAAMARCADACLWWTGEEACLMRGMYLPCRCMLMVNRRGSMPHEGYVSSMQMHAYGEQARKHAS
ncbi:hypothetical protein DUNSADRAFT_3404 [Dunaliella salina]|uniref:Secreted protein n=1 Tax=Dunaliella salina TaxID=3046 RepID=A0ABQ7GU04_DUNSA|nr:hypothetical protein DUNSADRAFT_3404 [Dunaliella salina]|eukprot:KAF5838095.1 hypothetical protein DUNSADRAFT_3404 [Dunaliella salina]